MDVSTQDHYLRHSLDCFRALGAGSFEAAAVHRSVNRAGVAIRFPPGVHGDTALAEVVIAYNLVGHRGLRNDRTSSAVGIALVHVADRR
jgi:hypothetical protein